MMNKRNIILTIILLFSMHLIAISQDAGSSIKDTESELTKLQERLQQTKQKRDQTIAEERRVLRQLNIVNERIRSRNRELQVLQNQLRRNETETRRLQGELRQARTKLDIGQAYLGSRIRLIYLSSLISPHQHILAKSDLSDELRRVRYKQILANADARAVSQVRAQTSKLSENQSELSNKIRSQETQQRELNRSKRQIQNEQRQQSNLLTRVRTNKSNLDKTVRDLESAAKRLENLLAELRARQAQFPDIYYGGEPFGQLKGRLIWPVASGSVIYGPGRREILDGRVEIISKGIGIRSNMGADVFAVHNGMVLYASWLEGSGNTVIIDHGQGYMTLYMHLSNINVRRNQEVGRREKIGTVGDTGSLDGVQLGFQIRRGINSVDPRDWLVRR